MSTSSFPERLKAVSAWLNPGPYNVGIAIGLMVLATVALVISIGIVCHLKEKSLPNPPAKKDGLTINFSRAMGLKLYMACLLTAIALTGMVTVWKPWLWGAMVVLLVGAGRLNAALQHISEPHKFDEVMWKTGLFILLWGIASWLAMGL
jgi:1,4-dihydroxy-2-naphthoate octaprenyltransferase